MGTILEQPARWQWEPSSHPDEPYNCGPTSASFILDFYRGGEHNIEAVRRSAHVAPATGTSATQQRDMLIANGVASHLEQPTISRVTSLVAARPIIVGLDMAYVPYAVRGHSFAGVHAVAIRGNTTHNGVAGKIISDPNFNPPSRPDPTGGHRFYSNALLNTAMGGRAHRWTVVPDKAPPSAVYAVIPAGGYLYFQPILDQAHVSEQTTAILELPYTGNVIGDDYTYPGGTSTKWAKVLRNGLTRFVPYYRATYLVR